jgi:6-phosphogluconolactonase
MHHELQTFQDVDATAKGSAHFIAERARLIVAESGRFTMALSGGQTPWTMLDELATLDLPWHNIVIYQVDERAAPDGDPDRNLTHIQDGLKAVHPAIIPMEVNDDDLEAAAKRYGEALPNRFDLIHLGLGPDGHTASLVPNDRVLEVIDRPVALSDLYDGRRRMTLTYPALARADQILWLVTGADKSKPLSQLLRGDTSIPAGRVTATSSLVMADRSAAGQ